MSMSWELTRQTQDDIIYIFKKNFLQRNESDPPSDKDHITLIMKSEVDTIRLTHKHDNLI